MSSVTTASPALRRETPRYASVTPGRRGPVALVRTYPLHTIVGMLSTVIIIGFFVVFYRADATTAFLDGGARLNMARRVHDNLQGTTSLAQLGSIWLPLMPALEVPLVLSETLYRTGIAGSIVSMLSFVGLVLIVFETARTLTGRVLAGVGASLVLVLNLNVLLFGTSTMAEMLLMAMLAACGLCLVRLEQSLAGGEASIRWIVLTSGSFMLVCLTRYEGYFVTAIAAPLVVLMLWTHNIRGHQLVATTGTLFALPMLSIVGWLVYEAVIYGDPLYFARSEYSARSIDVVNSDLDGPVGHPWKALQLYLDAVRWNYVDLVLLLAAAGMALLLWRTIAARLTSGLGAWYFALVPAFYVVALTIGEIGMDPDPASPYNVRYGIPAGIALAVFTGFAIGQLAHLPWHRAARPLALAAVLAIGAVTLPSWSAPVAHTVVLQDEGTNLQPGSAEIAAWIEQHHDHGLMLMDGFGGHKAYVQMHSGLTLNQFLTEANPDQWHAALANPTGHAPWIYIGSDDDDAVGRALAGSPVLEYRYVKVFENAAGRIYRLKDGPMQP